MIRNRIKRRIREIYRHHLPEIVGDIRLLVMGKPPAASASFVQLDEAFLGVVRRLRLLKTDKADKDDREDKEGKK